ncbi:MAG: AraC family transcriptional regulator [Pacificimonas sp.]|nr:AraC family transcriptional regulator [Pacificimonas sp.]
MLVDLPAHADRYNDLVGEGLLEMHFCQKGNLRIIGDWGETQIDGPALLLWYHPKSAPASFELVTAGATGYCGASIYCSETWLDRQGLMQDVALSTVWDAMVQPEGRTPKYCKLPLPPGAIPALNDLAGTRTPDVIDYLVWKARSFDLLASALQTFLSLNDESRRSTLFPADLARIAKARAILEANFVSPPSNQELARTVGINVSKLMSGFREAYGATIRETVRQLRMEHARQLLLDKSAPIGCVAYSVGYSHHSTFTVAFTEYFGESPSKFIRSSQQEIQRSDA